MSLGYLNCVIGKHAMFSGPESEIQKICRKGMRSLQKDDKFIKNIVEICEEQNREWKNYYEYV